MDSLRRILSASAATATARLSRPPSARPSAVPSAIILLVVAMIGAACGGNSPPEGLEPEGIFEWAHERFEAEDYGAAASALQEFLVRSPLDARADSAQYLLGEAHFRDGKHLQAAEAFSRLSRNRPTSELADDAQLGVCRSYWELSPELARDQEYTRQALDACDRMLQLYPDSPLRERAREMRNRARSKLAAKNYRVATWYFDQELYESANIYLQTILDRYPEAPVVPQAMLTLYESYRQIGFDAEAEQIRERLLREYPDSGAAGEIESGPDDSGQTRRADPSPASPRAAPDPAHAERIVPGGSIVTRTSRGD